MVGKKRSLKHVTDNEVLNLPVPPGFKSLTSFTLKKIVTGGDAAAAVDGEAEPGLVGVPLSNSALEKFKTSLIQRPWISHGKVQPVQHQDGSKQTGIEVKRRDPTGASLPKGVIRGCSDCDDCVKVTARWHPEDSHLPVVDDAPIFRPTEEEFKDTLKYIAKIRPRADIYGICRIIPPPSWRPPFLLENKEIWETSKIRTHVQNIDGVQNSFYKRKRSRLHENIETEMPKDAAQADLESCNECFEDSEEAKAIDFVSDFETGPEFTLKSFKKYADDFKVQYFSENDTVIATGKNQREPLIARVESEYWRIVEKPTEEIEVLFGTELANQSLTSGFPVAASSAQDMGKYVNSGWNLNNTPDLYGSLLRLGCYKSSSVAVPQMFIGMCFASQCWRVEDHHLYSLSYLHSGSPKVWYSIPEKYCFKFMELVKKRFPKLSKHPKLLHELVAQLSPSMLISEGIPVYRCLQNPFEFVVTFPGVYYSEFSCGFNCSEAVCFAPLDWLPHGQDMIEVYAGYCFKTALSHDKLLLGAAMEAVASLWDSLVNKRDSAKIRLWRSVCGKEGILTRLLKLRVEGEGTRRKHLCNMKNSTELDESDVGTKRECCICFYDLFLSAVACPCSPNRYSCLRHVKQLCSCSWYEKQFLFRYKITDLTLLVEALEENLKALHSWAKRNTHPSASSSAMDKQKNPIAVASLSELNCLASSKSRTPALDLGNGENTRAGSSGSECATNGTALKKHVVHSGVKEEDGATRRTSLPPPMSLPNRSTASNSGIPGSGSKKSGDQNVVVLIDDED